MSDRDQPNEHTTSVVICAYTADRWVLFGEAVASVQAQQPVPQIVIVIDHNDELLSAARQEWPGLVVVANEHEQGLSGARNTGVEHSTGSIVAFLDDDAVAAPGWLATMVRHFDNPDVGGAGGLVQPRWLTPEPAWFPPEFRWVIGCSYLGLPQALAEVRNPIGASMAFRADVLKQVGGFVSEIGRIGTLPLGCEETELSIRARALGFIVLHDPESIVHHAVTPNRTTVSYFFRRCYAEGISKAIVTSLAGMDSGLSSERSYVARTLPGGVVTSLRAAVSGPQRGAALLRAGAVVGGVAAAGAGFVRGKLVRRRRIA